MVGRLCDIPCVNAIYVHQFGDLLVAFMTLALPLLRSYTGILTFAIVYGIGDGIFVTTMNSLLLFTVDEKRRAAALALGSCLLALSIAGGPPLAGKFVVCIFSVTHTPTNQSIDQSITLSIHPSINRTIHQPTQPPTHTSINPSIHPSVS